MPRVLSRSRLDRRLHKVADLVHTLFHQLGAALKAARVSTEYLLDSFPAAVCDNIRIKRCRLARGEQFQYVDAFMQNVNWEEVNRRAEAVTKR